MFLSRNLAILAVAASLSGCAISRVYVGPRDVTAGESHSFTSTSFFWGIIPASPVNAAGACANGVQKITTKRGFLSWLVSHVTVGIVKPTNVTVTCIK
jgi:hypothetical protein